MLGSWDGKHLNNNKHPLAYKQDIINGENTQVSIQNVGNNIVTRVIVDSEGK